MTVVKNGDGTYTVTVTNLEQTVIAKVATRDSLTHAQAADRLFSSRIRELIAQYRERTAAALAEKYDAANGATKATVDTALNFTPPEV